MQVKQSKRLFGLFNGLDIFILLILMVALIFGIYWVRSGGGTTTAQSQHTYTYTVEGRQVREEVVEAVQIGANVYDSQDGTYLGVIKDVSYGPFQEVMFNRVTGEYELLTQPGYCNIYVEIEGNGTEDAQNIFVEGEVVKVGAPMYIKSKGFACSGYISEIKDGE